MTKEAPKSIALVMAAVMADIQAITKEQRNTAQGYIFRGIDDVYNALHPVFAAHGLICLPRVKEVRNSTFKLANGKDTFHTHVRVGYLFVAPDGSSLEAETCGEGMDLGDKGTAKALSFAHKYLLLETFLVPTKDLIDADTYDPTIIPADELRKIREQDAEQAVREAVANGTPTEPTAEQEAKLAEKRAEAQAAAEKRAAEGDPDVTIVPPAKKTRAAKSKPAEAPKSDEVPEHLQNQPVGTSPKAAPAAPAVPANQAETTDDDIPFEDAPAPLDFPWAKEKLTLAHPDYKDKEIGALTPALVKPLYDNWLVKNIAKIVTDATRKQTGIHIVQACQHYSIPVDPKIASQLGLK